MVTILHGATIVTPDRTVEDGWVRIDGDTIVDVGTAEPPDGEPVDLGGGWLTPGFVDVHCHGGGGGDFGSADPWQIDTAARFHQRHGTTSLLASLMTAPIADLCRQLEALADHIETADPPVVGVHLEGPFLAHARCGAQNPKALIPPDSGAFRRLLDAARGTVKMITIAPELPGALDLVEEAVGAGVVAAVGHTDATYAQTTAAFERGATVATHLFNGMRPLHHREPGPVLAALDAGAAVEVINDGVHLHPAVTAMIARSAPAKALFITDAISAAGVGDGAYSLGGQPVRVDDGQARLVSDGSLAGSTLTMDVAVRRALSASNLPITAAIAAAAAVPAEILGLPAPRGAIARRHHADLVHLDDELNVKGVMRAGIWRPGHAAGASAA